jgi:hypothetical protein
MLAHVDSPLFSQMERQTLMDGFLYVNRDANGYFGLLRRKSPSGCGSYGYDFSQCAPSRAADRFVAHDVARSAE